LKGLSQLEIPVILDTDSETFHLVAQYLNKLHYLSVHRDVVEDIKMRWFRLLGNMRITVEIKVAKGNYELEQEAESWRSRGM
jgi:hypothetical protein